MKSSSIKMDSVLMFFKIHSGSQNRLRTDVVSKLIKLYTHYHRPNFDIASRFRMIRNNNVPEVMFSSWVRATIPNHTGKASQRYQIVVKGYILTTILYLCFLVASLYLCDLDWTYPRTRFRSRFSLESIFGQPGCQVCIDWRSIWFDGMVVSLTVWPTVEILF